MTQKRLYYLIILILVLFLFETAAQKVFARGAIFIPQLTLMFIIVFAMGRTTLPEILWFGFGVGFVGELFSGLFFGSMILGATAAGLGVYFATRTFTSQEASFGRVVFVVAAGTALFVFASQAYHALAAALGLAQPMSLSISILKKTAWAILANFIIFYPLRFLLNAKPFSFKKYLGT